MLGVAFPDVFVCDADFREVVGTDVTQQFRETAETMLPVEQRDEEFAGEIERGKVMLIGIGEGLLRRSLVTVTRPH